MDGLSRRERRGMRERQRQREMREMREREMRERERQRQREMREREREMRASWRRMPCVGRFADVRKSEEMEMICLDWKIRLVDTPGFLRLPRGYKSPRFYFSHARWRCLIRPNYSSTANSTKSVLLGLWRVDEGPSLTCTVNVRVGARVADGGVAWRSEWMRREFRKDEAIVLCALCDRSELDEQRHTLMPDDTLTVAFEMTALPPEKSSPCMPSQSSDADECCETPVVTKPCEVVLQLCPESLWKGKDKS